MRAFGIDVSSIQGAIDWVTVGKQGLTFVDCKATEGVGHDLDSKFVHNMKAAKANGLMCSLYHWHVWIRDPAEQAENIVWAANLAGGVDFPIALDFEHPTPDTWVAKGVNCELMLRNLLDLSEDVELRMGDKPRIYTMPWMISSLVAPIQKVSPELIAKMAEHDLWIASGNRYLTPWTPTEADLPDVPKPWKSWRMWQYSGGTATKGGKHVPGIMGFVDRNCFNGTAEDFFDWAGCPKTVRERLPEEPKRAAIDVFERAK